MVIAVWRPLARRVALWDAQQQGEAGGRCGGRPQRGGLGLPVAGGVMAAGEVEVTIVLRYPVVPGSGGYPDAKTVADCAEVDACALEAGACDPHDILGWADNVQDITFKAVE